MRNDSVILENIHYNVHSFNDALNQIENDILNRGGLDINNINQLDREVEEINDGFLMFQNQVTDTRCDNSIQVVRRNNGTQCFAEWNKSNSTDVKKLAAMFFNHIWKSNYENSIQVPISGYGTIGLLDWVKSTSIEFFMIRTLINDRMW